MVKFLGLNITRNKQTASSEAKSMSYTTNSLWRSITNAIDGISVDNYLFYDMYKQNPDIRSAIRKKALYIGGAGVTLLDEKGDEWYENDKKQEWNELMQMLNNPTFYDTKLEMVKHLDVSGELYLVPTTSLRGEINGFTVLHPKSISKVIKDGVLVGVKQVVGGTSKTYNIATPGMSKNQLLKSVFMHKLEKHTDNEFDGMGLLEGIVYDVKSDLKAQEGNYYAMVNEFGIPGMLMLEPGLSETEQAIIAQQLQAKHQGAKNKGKMFMGVGVKDYKHMQLSPKDMEQSLQRQITTEKVCSALGVPKSILNYTDKVNYNTSLNDRREFIEGTINAYQKMFEYIINGWLELYKPDYKYKIHFTERQAEDDIELKKLQLDEVKNGAITINEYRQMNKWEASNEENADKLIVNKNAILLEDMILDPVLDTNNT